MKVVEYEIEDGARLASVYNDHFADGLTPRCHPVTEDEFCIGLTRRLRDEQPVTAFGLRGLRLIAVERKDRPVAFSHIAVESSTEDGQTSHRGLIRVLAFAAEDRVAGQKLLEASEARLLEHDIAGITIARWSAAVRFMHSGREEPSTLRPHLVSLPRLNGYEIERSTHIMTLDRIDLMEPALPDASMEATVETTESRGERPNFVVRLMQGSAEVGFCELESRGHFLRAASAQASLFVHDLEVDETFQGSGYGRYLLRKALWEATRLGFTDASLCVMPDNDRAIMLYAAEGFRLETTTHQLGKRVG